MHAVPRHISAPRRIIVARHEQSLVNNNIIIIVSTRLIGENTNMCMFNCCCRSEVKCDYLTTVKQSQAVFLLEYFVILL